MKIYFLPIGFSAFCSVFVYAQAPHLASSKMELPRQQTKPNILWLTYEDTSPQFIGCYGNQQARTPHIDQLAKEGVRFTSAFATAAVSSASRFCILTGIPANNMGTGNHRSSYAIPSEVRGFPAYLRQAGYYTSNNSKTDYNLQNAKKLTKEAWDESSDNADWRKRKPGQPFFAVYNSASSHQSRTMTNTWKKYEAQVLQHLTSEEVIAPDGLEMPAFYRRSAEMEKNISRVYNSVELMDKEFGQWLSKLEADGLKDSTIVFCFSDHGQGISRAKGSALAMGYRVPFIVWIPEMYKHLSPWGSGVVTSDKVSFEDLAPSMLHLAGVPIPEYMKGEIFTNKDNPTKRQYIFSGVDRTDESSELSRSVSDGRYLYTRVFMPYQAFARWNMYFEVSKLQQDIRADYKKGLLNAQQKAILEPRVAEYLYDLENDKWEIINLVNDPKLKGKTEELRSKMIENILHNRDPHFMPEYVLKQTNIAPYALAADKEAYPLQEILDAALLVGRGRNVIGEQLKALSDTNAYVRYWAAIGLFSQTETMPKHLMKEIERYRANEIFPPVSLIIDALLYKNEGSRYLSKVKELLSETDTELLRMSLSLLLTLDLDRQKPLLPLIKQRLEINKSEKEKDLYQCNEYMELFIHKLDNTILYSNDLY